MKFSKTGINKYSMGLYLRYSVDIPSKFLLFSMSVKGNMRSCQFWSFFFNVLVEIVNTNRNWSFGSVIEFHSIFAIPQTGNKLFCKDKQNNRRKLFPISKMKYLLSCSSYGLFSMFFSYSQNVKQFDFLFCNEKLRRFSTKRFSFQRK